MITMMSSREIQGLLYDSLFHLFPRLAELSHPPRSSLRHLPFPFNCCLQSTRMGHFRVLSWTCIGGGGSVYWCQAVEEE